MTDEQKKRAEELAKEYQADDSRIKIGPANSFLAGYEAGLNDPEALGGLLEEIDLVIVEALDKDVSASGLNFNETLFLFGKLHKISDKIQAFKERGRV